MIGFHGIPGYYVRWWTIKVNSEDEFEFLDHRYGPFRTRWGAVHAAEKIGKTDQHVEVIR